MLPTFKECVEALFLRGLCRVVFATETLALGINMPARSVVIEKLSKWNGETHADITPGEYTQLTGRAGRRGIDVEGHGVVLWQQGFDPKAAGRPRLDPHLPARSSFRRRTTWRSTWCTSSAASARASCWSVVRPVPGRQGRGRAGRQLRKAEEALDGYAEAATCDRGDFMEYAGCGSGSRPEKARPGAPRRPARGGVDSLESCGPAT
jgi:ATP-dependent RNA helicase HelY